jgi:hypothetical protein
MTRTADCHGHRTTLTARLKANRPPKGRTRRDWYLYDVVFDHRTIVAGSRDPETDMARVLFARGIVGKITLIDAKTGEPRTVVDIEKAAKITIEDSRKRGLRVARFQPGTFLPWIKAGEAA